MDVRLSDRQVWGTTLLFVVLDLIALTPLLFVARTLTLRDMSTPIGAASALFWGIAAFAFILGGWELYYRYIYPSWMRWLIPVDIFLYGAIGLGLWWIAHQAPDSTMLWFVLLGGLEGIAEHVLGIYGLRILEKVPWLNEVHPLPALVFSFFEYILYWTLVSWLGLGFLKISALL
jgi:hypothetical protein